MVLIILRVNPIDRAPRWIHHYPPSSRLTLPSKDKHMFSPRSLFTRLFLLAEMFITRPRLSYTLRSRATKLSVTLLMALWLALNSCPRIVGAQHAPRTAVVIVRSEHALFEYLKSALNSRGSVRLDYAADCRMPGYLEFRPVNIRQPMIGSGITAVQEMFSGDGGVSVRKDHNGLIRITIGAVDTAVLGTVIPTFILTPSEQYNPYLAFEVLQEKSTEMSSWKRRREIDPFSAFRN